jgi:predicted RNase H-like nuclease (RuvC/YqgF family)
MNVTEIIVSAARTFNHPYEQYSNLRPGVTMKATLAEGEDVVAATKQLQQQAEGLVEDHKQALLSSIQQIENMQRAEREVASLAREISRHQSRLDELRRDFPQLTQLALPCQDAD